MKWPFAAFLLLSGLPVGAATFVFSDGFGSNVIGGPAPGVPAGSGDKQFTFNIDDRTGLTAGAPVRVTFSVAAFSAPFDVWVQSSGTFTDVFTVTGILGGQSDFVTSSLFSRTFEGSGNPPGGPMAGGLISASFPETFDLIVPWETDLTTLSVNVRQTITFNGAGNGILFAGAGGPLTVTTQSVPEPGTTAFAIAIAGLALISRRSYSCPR